MERQYIKRVFSAIVTFEIKIYYKNQIQASNNFYAYYNGCVGNKNCCHGWSTVVVLFRSDYIFLSLQKNLRASYLPPSTQHTQIDNLDQTILHKIVPQKFAKFSLWAPGSLISSYLIWCSLACCLCLYSVIRHLLPTRTHHDLWHFPADCYPIYINWMQCILHTLVIILIHFSS